MKTRHRIFTLIALLLIVPGIALADEVTEWNKIMLDAIRTSGLSPVVGTRAAATVQAAVYDAVNGIERRYTPIHVQPDAARGASVRAAAVQAAYASLVQLFPAQASSLAGKRGASLAAIASGEAAEHSQSTARGVAWGQTVANAIVAWRNTDGFNPPPPANNGNTAPGPVASNASCLCVLRGGPTRQHNTVGHFVPFGLSCARPAAYEQRSVHRGF